MALHSNKWLGYFSLRDWLRVVFGCAKLSGVDLSSIGIISGSPAATKSGTHVGRPEHTPSAPNTMQPAVAAAVGMCSNVTKFTVFESSVDPIMRFCIDKDVHGACWLKLPAKAFRLRGSSPSEARWSTCQLEAECAMADLMSLAPEAIAAKFVSAPESAPAAGACVHATDGSFSHHFVFFSYVHLVFVQSFWNFVLLVI
jgi:hypothetical protein